MEQVTFSTYLNLGFSSYCPFVYYCDDIIAFLEEYLFGGQVMKYFCGRPIARRRSPSSTLLILTGAEIFVVVDDVVFLADIDRCRDFFVVDDDIVFLADIDRYRDFCCCC